MLSEQPSNGGSSLLFFDKLLSAPSNEIDGNVRLNSDGLMQQVGDTER